MRSRARFHPVEDIPPESRTIVFERDHGLCVRCAMPGSDWHHRRSRRVRDEHRHCPCNGVILCRTCHKWAHTHPLEAMEKGWLVSIYITHPASVPQHRVDGWWITLCAGQGVALRADHVRLAASGRPVIVRPGEGLRERRTG